MKQLLESCRRSICSVARRGPMLVAAIVALTAAAATANAYQDPIVDYQPTYVAGYSPYVTRYYGTVSPYPVGYYTYPNYVYPGVIGGYSVGYYPYAFPPPYRAPLWPYAGLYGYGGWTYGVYPGWGPAYPYAFGF